MTSTTLRFACLNAFVSLADHCSLVCAHTPGLLASQHERGGDVRKTRHSPRFLQRCESSCFVCCCWCCSLIAVLFGGCDFACIELLVVPAYHEHCVLFSFSSLRILHTYLTRFFVSVVLSLVFISVLMFSCSHVVIVISVQISTTTSTTTTWIEHNNEQ